MTPELTRDLCLEIIKDALHFYQDHRGESFALVKPCFGMPTCYRRKVSPTEIIDYLRNNAFIENNKKRLIEQINFMIHSYLLTMPYNFGIRVEELKIVLSLIERIL